MKIHNIVKDLEEAVRTSLEFLENNVDVLTESEVERTNTDVSKLRVAIDSLNFVAATTKASHIDTDR